MLYVIVEGKKATKPRSEKSRKFKIFAKGLVMVLVQNGLFFHLLISGNVGQEKVFYHILERKNVFLG